MTHTPSEFLEDVLADAAPAPPRTRAGRILQSLDRAVSVTAEAVCAALLVAEVVLLGASTTARYVFGNPLPWSDELAELLFIWLAVLGAVVALRRGEHMRLTFFVRGMAPHRRSWLDALAMMLIAAVLLALVMPAY